MGNANPGYKFENENQKKKHPMLMLLKPVPQTDRLLRLERRSMLSNPTTVNSWLPPTSREVKLSWSIEQLQMARTILEGMLIVE